MEFDSEAVDAMTEAGRRTHQQLRGELRLVIRGGQLLADVEVVLGVLAVEVAGHRDRRHVVQRRAQALRELDHRAGALDVDRLLLGLPGRDVVDRRAVHHVVDPTELREVVAGQRQAGQLTDQGFRTLTPLGGQPLESPERLATDQHRHLRVRPGLQQTRYDAAPDKPGTAGNDISHSAIVAARGRARQLLS